MEIVVYTDNQSVVDVWRSGVTTDGTMLGLLRRIFFFGAQFNLNIVLYHISGYSNVNADLLSRLQVEEFLNLNPGVDESPQQIPEDAWSVS